MSPTTKHTIRTGIQTLLAIAAVVPLLAAAIANTDGLAEALPWLAATAPTAATIAAGVARIMALPAVETFLDRLGIGLTDDGGSTE
ncbi:hypothetical protein ABZZ74_49195 [Streptomyces sp. NPDC006476]|uniref:hypothetical protein n=1 Tax=Streptomyces sp. NPDC006476 TaxID=3157175 RepID=UPI0033B22F51